MIQTLSREREREREFLRCTVNETKARGGEFSALTDFRIYGGMYLLETAVVSSPRQSRLERLTSARPAGNPASEMVRWRPLVIPRAPASVRSVGKVSSAVTTTNCAYYEYQAENVSFFFFFIYLRQMLNSVPLKYFRNQFPDFRKDWRLSLLYSYQYIYISISRSNKKNEKFDQKHPTIW